jgi:hypothetical protein
MTRQRMFTTLVLGLALAIPTPAFAQFAFTTIEVPGSTYTAANGNSPNAIVGEFDDKDGITHGFVLNKGVFTQIDVPGALKTVCGRMGMQHLGLMCQ